VLKDLGRLLLAALAALVTLILVYVGAILALVVLPPALFAGRGFLLRGLFSPVSGVGLFVILMVAFYANLTGQRLPRVLGFVVCGIALMLGVGPSFEYGSGGVGAVSGSIGATGIELAIAAVVVSLVLLGLTRLRPRQ